MGTLVIPHFTCRYLLQSIASVIACLALAVAVLKRRSEAAAARQLYVRLEAEAHRYLQSAFRQGHHAVSKRGVAAAAKAAVMAMHLPPTTPAGLSSPPTAAAREQLAVLQWGHVQRTLDLSAALRSSTVQTDWGTEAAWATADIIYQ